MKVQWQPMNGSDSSALCQESTALLGTDGYGFGLCFVSSELCLHINQVSDSIQVHIFLSLHFT